MHKVLAGITVRPFWRLAADLRFRWIGNVSTLPTNVQFHGQRMPGYYDVNLNLRAEDVAPGLDVHLSIQNLTDNRYYTFGLQSESGQYLPRIPQPQFRFLLGATRRWGKAKAASPTSEGAPASRASAEETDQALDRPAS